MDESPKPHFFNVEIFWVLVCKEARDRTVFYFFI